MDWNPTKPYSLNITCIARAEFEKDLEPFCLENNIGVINYYSLASGFLTGKYRSDEDLSKSQRGGGIKKYLDERGLRILDALDEVAKEYNRTRQCRHRMGNCPAGHHRPYCKCNQCKTIERNTLQALELNLNREAIDLLKQASSY